jgi:AAA15 family ATPase/GTPase
MLVYFRAENFRSIKEPIELDLRAAPRLRRLKGHVRTPSKDDKSLKVLKSAVLYGANASGKSNVLKAIHFAQEMVTGHVIPNTPIVSEPFSLTDNVESDSSFYFEFVAEDQLWGFGIRFNAERIKEESLTIYLNSGDTSVYSRKHVESEEYQLVSSLTDGYLSDSEKTEFEFLIKYTPKNRLFISECEERGGFKKLEKLGGVIGTAFQFISHSLIFIFPETKFRGLYLKDKPNKKVMIQLTQLLSNFDTGVEGITQIAIEESFFPEHVMKPILENAHTRSETSISFYYENKQYYASIDREKKWSFFRINTLHNLPSGKKTQLELNQESDGTLRLLDLLPTASEGAISDLPFTFLIDEFDRSLHPNLAKAFLNLFLNSEHSDNDNQLIASTHEAELLDNDLLRRDEIWFVQKEWDSASRLYCLNDYSTRFDKDIHKAYLSGKFGAVPILMDEFKK